MQLGRRFLFPLIAIVYLAFLTQSFFWDGVLFSYNIEQVHAHNQPFSLLLQPNHLLYSPFGFVLYLAARAIGLHARSITLLQIWNTLVAVFVAVPLFRWSRKHTGSPYAAVFCVLLFGFGATWWKYATDADAYMISVRMFLLAVLFTLKSKPRLLAAGACHITGMLFHELAVFAYAPVLAAIWLSDLPVSSRLKRMTAYTVATAASVAAIYYLCYRAAAAQYTTVGRWVTTYAADTRITKTPRQLATEYIVSYGKLFAGGKFSAVRDAFSLWTVIGLCLCAAGLVFFALLVRKPDQPVEPLDKRTRLVLWAWLLPLGAFLAWFDPGNAAHKLFLWPAIVMLIATAAWTQRHARAALALAIALAGWNFAGYIYPHSRPDGDPLVAFARQLGRELPANATVYYAAFSPDDWYLAYFAPNTHWRALPASGPACFETTALAAMPHAEMKKTWTLSAKGRNVHVACTAGN